MKYIIIFLSIIFSQECRGANKENEERCERLSEKVNILYFEYSFFNDTTYTRLDSALCLIDSLTSVCDKYYVGLSTTKIKILSLKKEYMEAIGFINTLEKDKILPLNKSILLKRFYAMKAISNGDSISFNKYLKSIVEELKVNMTENSKEIDSVFRLPNILDITKNRHVYSVIQYYYYRSQIEGSTKISLELDSIQQRTNGNIEFFDNMLKKNLDNDFMSFNGI